MERERKGKSILIGVLCAIILFMSVGFALQASRLEIKGTARITGSWNVQIVSITEKTKEGKVTVKENYPTKTSTTATFDVTLAEPGDKIVYDVKVANNGTLDAYLKTMTDEANRTTGEEAILINVEGPGVNDELASGGEHTYTVTIEYDPNAVGENAPTIPEGTAELTKTFTLVLDYEQKAA